MATSFEQLVFAQLSYLDLREFKLLDGKVNFIGDEREAFEKALGIIP